MFRALAQMQALEEAQFGGMSVMRKKGAASSPSKRTEERGASSRRVEPTRIGEEPPRAESAKKEQRPPSRRVEPTRIGEEPPRAKSAKNVAKARPSQQHGLACDVDDDDLHMRISQEMSYDVTYWLHDVLNLPLRKHGAEVRSLPLVEGQESKEEYTGKACEFYITAIRTLDRDGQDMVVLECELGHDDAPEHYRATYHYWDSRDKALKEFMGKVNVLMRKSSRMSSDDKGDDENYGLEEDEGGEEDTEDDEEYQ